MDPRDHTLLLPDHPSPAHTRANRAHMYPERHPPGSPHSQPTHSPSHPPGSHLVLGSTHHSDILRDRI